MGVVPTGSHMKQIMEMVEQIKVPIARTHLRHILIPTSVLRQWLATSLWQTAATTNTKFHDISNTQIPNHPEGTDLNPMELLLPNKTIGTAVPTLATSNNHRETMGHRTEMIGKTREVGVREGGLSAMAIVADKVRMIKVVMAMAVIKVTLIKEAGADTINMATAIIDSYGEFSMPVMYFSSKNYLSTVISAKYQIKYHSL